MTGWQLQATSADKAPITVRGDVIYMDQRPALRMLCDLRETEEHDMLWTLVPVDVQLEGA